MVYLYLKHAHTHTHTHTHTKKQKKQNKRKEPPGTLKKKSIWIFWGMFSPEISEK